MSGNSESRHGMWSNRWLFVLAAAGSAVGLGNLWRFPYITGENGGGAFVLIYLVCIALVGIPIMMAEVLIGREGRQSPVNSMRSLLQQHHRHRSWELVGWMGVVAGFLILSFYAVIAGWALKYVFSVAGGGFAGATGEQATAAFNQFLASPWELLFWHTLFMVLVVFIISRGVAAGLETAVRWLMPLLFVLLAVLVGYGVTSGGFAQGVDFMFGLEWSKLTGAGLFDALGHAFFTLSLGMGAIMAYGAYVPSSVSISTTVVTIAVLDTLVALAAGLAIFPVVFANGLEPAQGPGLMFVTVPLAFGQMPLGVLFGALFFVLVGFAAITSAISLTEPALAYFVEQRNVKRSKAAVTIGAVCWLLGVGTVLSFNEWSDVHLLKGMTFFDVLDYFTQNILLPLGGLFIALFAAYALPKAVLKNQLGIKSALAEKGWLLLAGILAPLGVLAVFLVTIIGLDNVRAWLS